MASRIKTWNAADLVKLLGFPVIVDTLNGARVKGALYSVDPESFDCIVLSEGSSHQYCASVLSGHSVKAVYLDKQQGSASLADLRRSCHLQRTAPNIFSKSKVIGVLTEVLSTFVRTFNFTSVSRN